VLTTLQPFEAREKLRAVFETLNFLAILCNFDQIQKQSK
jgi:hypothetical protein